jgi:hypothetical protein
MSPCYLMLDAALLVFNKVSRNSKNNDKKFMNESIVSAEAKARLTEAVKNYTPPPPEKYRALEEVKDCIVELRDKQASPRPTRVPLRLHARSSRTEMEKRSRVCFRQRHGGGRCVPAPFQPSLRLHFTFPLAEPLTEARNGDCSASCGVAKISPTSLKNCPG